MTDTARPILPQKAAVIGAGLMGTGIAVILAQGIPEVALMSRHQETLDRSRVGIAGHSLGASAVSYVGQIDPRVDATVAWDNLSAPSGPPACPSGSSPRPDNAPITKPAMGMSADYFLVPQPYTADPDPQAKNQGFLAYKKAGVDSMESIIRGGLAVPGRHPGCICRRRVLWSSWLLVRLVWGRQ